VRACLLGACLLIGAAASAQPLTLLNPKEARSSTAREFVNVLARTTPGAQARVEGVDVPVYSTGVFLRDRVPLAAGANTLRVEVRMPGGDWQAQVLEVERTPPTLPALPPEGLWIDAASLLPRELRRGAPGEVIALQLRGTPGQLASYAVDVVRGWMPMVEREPGLYVARLVLQGDADREPLPIEYQLAPKETRLFGPRLQRAASPAGVGLWRREAERLFVTGPGGAALLHGVHEVRLGGPFLAELPAGVLLRATGQHSDMLRVQLAPGTGSWVRES
jgi:N-acetylmuramoyl-L-alanine amidase